MIRHQLNNIAKVGRNYNGRLLPFVQCLWNPDTAAENADSLKRTITAIKPSIDLRCFFEDSFT